MVKYKLEKRIKQITPMIHFQPNQCGATLRATELKPKLDRFILKLANVSDKLLDSCELGTEKEQLHSVKNFDEKYFIKNDNPDVKALNYKVRIKAEGDNKCLEYPVRHPSDRKKGYGAFFPIDDEEKDSSFFDYIIIEFVSFNSELLQLIDAVFQMFLSATSFGFRQNKGFGHFIVEGSENRQLKEAKKYCRMFPKEYRLFVANMKPSCDYKKILDMINVLNSKVKKTMCYRKEKEKRNEIPLKKKQIVPISSYCERFLGKLSQDDLIEIIPEASVYEEDKKEEQRTLNRVNSLQQVALLLEGQEKTDHPRVILEGQKDEIYDGEIYYHDFVWKNILEDRKESPMYFIPLKNDKQDNFKQVLIILDCGRLEDIQEELFVKVEAKIKKPGNSVVVKQAEKLVPTKECTGLLQDIFCKVLRSSLDKNVTMEQII